jgi:hypothetical protein
MYNHKNQYNLNSLQTGLHWNIKKTYSTIDIYIYTTYKAYYCCYWIEFAFSWHQFSSDDDDDDYDINFSVDKNICVRFEALIAVNMNARL